MQLIAAIDIQGLDGKGLAIHYVPLLHSSAEIRPKFDQRLLIDALLHRYYSYFS
jgi:hypothetical protein